MVQEKDQGVMFASNRGCELARGDYIARMDADDRAFPERLGLQANFMDAEPDYGAVAGRVEHVGDPETTGGFQRFVEWSNSVISYQDIYNRRFIELAGQNIVYSGNDKYRPLESYLEERVGMLLSD